MHASLPVNFASCLSLDHTLFPHLDLDHIEESLEVGWKNGLSLGIWIVDRTCVSDVIDELD